MAAERDIERLQAFSDGVIVVAMTLLVLDVRLPTSPDGMDYAALAQALIGIWPKYLGYVVSFLVIANFWMSHVRKFRHLVRINTPFVWMNILFLLGVGLIPFSTAVISENPGQLSTQVYAALMALNSLLLALMWAYAGAKNLISRDLSKRQRQVLLLQPVLGVGIFVLSIGIAAFSPTIAKIVWVLLVPASFRWAGAVREGKGSAFG